MARALADDADCSGTVPAAPSGQPTSRRAVVRAAVWSAPVIATVAAAPAFAASTGPLTVTASKSGNQLILTFTGGEMVYPVTINSVTYVLVVLPIAVTMNPTVVASSAGGTSTGNSGSASTIVVRTYTVSYTWRGGTFTTTVAA